MDVGHLFGETSPPRLNPDERWTRSMNTLCDYAAIIEADRTSCDALVTLLQSVGGDTDHHVKAEDLIDLCAPLKVRAHAHLPLRPYMPQRSVHTRSQVCADLNLLY